MFTPWNQAEHVLLTIRRENLLCSCLCPTLLALAPGTAERGSLQYEKLILLQFFSKNIINNKTPAGNYDSYKKCTGQNSTSDHGESWQQAKDTVFLGQNTAIDDFVVDIFHIY